MELAAVRGARKKRNEMIRKEKEELREEMNGEGGSNDITNGGEGSSKDLNVDGEKYQDSYDADSPNDSDESGERSSKKKKVVNYPRSIDKYPELFVRRRFKDKDDFRLALDNYRVLKGVNVPIKKGS